MTLSLYLLTQYGKPPNALFLGYDLQLADAYGEEEEMFPMNVLPN